MPSPETVQQFVKVVEDGLFVEAMQRFYADDATAQENGDPPRSGLPALIAHERGTLAAFRAVRGRAVGPVFIAGDAVAINWHFEFDHPAGMTLRLDEVALQE